MSESEIRELLEGAGKRPDVPDEDVRAVAGAARAVWQRRYPPRRRWPRRLLLAAAVVAIALALGWWIAPRPTPGTIVSTSSDRMALNVGGRSLRLDAATRVRLVGATVVELLEGAVYLDSRSSHAPITIRTAAADFTPVGTQFEVRLADSGAALRVREGVVRVDAGGRSFTAGAGEEVIVGRDGAPSRGTIAPYDRRWNWVIEAGPRFEIEGRTLRAYLEWLAREQGRTLRFAGDEVARASESTTLHGSIAGLSAEDGLETVMLSTGFEARAADGELVISKQ